MLENEKYIFSLEIGNRARYNRDVVSASVYGGIFQRAQYRTCAGMKEKRGLK